MAGSPDMLLDQKFYVLFIPSLLEICSVFTSCGRARGGTVFTHGLQLRFSKICLNIGGLFELETGVYMTRVIKNIENNYFPSSDLCT